MRRMERIAGLGDAATGLVHEIKNPLTALSIHIQLLEERLAEPAAPEGTAELIGVLKAEADRLNNALDGFWDYARIEGLAVQPTDAMAILERVVQLIRPQAERQGVRVELRRPTGPAGRGAARPREVPAGGAGTWRSTRWKPCRRAASWSLEAADDDGTFSVVVTDTGPGIPAEIREDIFKPYFSTKTPWDRAGAGPDREGGRPAPRRHRVPDGAGRHVVPARLPPGQRGRRARRQREWKRTASAS